MRLTLAAGCFITSWLGTGCQASARGRFGAKSGHHHASLGYLPDQLTPDDDPDDCKIAAAGRTYLSLTARGPTREGFDADVERNRLFLLGQRQQVADAEAHHPAGAAAAAAAGENASALALVERGYTWQDVTRDDIVPEGWLINLDLDPKPVGKGALGTVYLGTVKCNVNQTMAVKLQFPDKQKLEEDKKGMREDVEKEIDLMYYFTTSDFIRIFDHTIDNTGPMVILMEGATGGDLGKVVKSRMPRERKVLLFIEALRGVAYMHANGYVHRDLKPANIVVAGDCAVEDCHAKVADLGLSCRVGDGDCSGIRGTPTHIAPEVYMTGGKSSGKNDVWSLGVILFELLFGNIPAEFERGWAHSEKEGMARAICEFHITGNSRFKKESVAVKEFLRGLLWLDPKTRWSAATALERAPEALGVAAAPEAAAAPAEMPACWKMREGL